MIKVFVTKDRPWKYFNDIERGRKAAFIYRSCITLKVVAQEPPPPSDWVFFSSPSGVRLFLEHYTLEADVKIAVLGDGTAAALEGVHLHLDFAPSHSDIALAVAEFAERLEPGATVLYPRSTESLLRLHSAVSAPQLIDWPFYENLPNPPGYPIYDDYLVFTSPSNARAYLDAHRVRTSQRVVAIGQSTAASLSARGLQGFLVSEAPTPETIWKCIAEDAGLPG